MKWFIILLSIVLIDVSAKNVDLSNEYQLYRKCLQKVEEEIKDAKKIKVIHAIKGADVLLQCFSCVSPEDGVEIDSTYKPSAGVVGRSMNTVFDFFKKVLMKSGHVMVDRDQWKYDWEFAKTGQGFQPLSSMHFSVSDAISDRIRRFTSKDSADFTLGDRYELTLKNVDGNSNGFYRCKNSHRRNIISNMYYLEVSNRKELEYISNNNNSISMKSGKLEEENIRYEIQPSPWSECSYCSSVLGEQTRVFRCYIVPTNDKHTFTHFEFFDKIPCSSTLVPIGIRKKLNERGLSTVLLQSRSCISSCPTVEAELAHITNKSELGDMRLLDYLPAGEFVFGDVLPRLLPPVVRRVQIVIENDPLVMSCQRQIDPNSGVHWISMKRGTLQVNNITTMYSGRAYFDDDANLIFDEFQMDDDDEYFCYSSNNILLGTFHMRVVENDKNQQIIEIVQIFVKFAAFILVFSLIASQLFE